MNKFGKIFAATFTTSLAIVSGVLAVPVTLIGVRALYNMADAFRFAKKLEKLLAKLKERDPSAFDDAISNVDEYLSKGDWVGAKNYVNALLA